MSCPTLGLQSAYGFKGLSPFPVRSPSGGQCSSLRRRLSWGAHGGGALENLLVLESSSVRDLSWNTFHLSESASSVELPLPFLQETPCSVDTSAHLLPSTAPWGMVKPQKVLSPHALWGPLPNPLSLLSPPLSTIVRKTGGTFLVLMATSSVHLPDGAEPWYQP